MHRKKSHHLSSDKSSNMSPNKETGSSLTSQPNLGYEAAKNRRPTLLRSLLPRIIIYLLLALVSSAVLAYTLSPTIRNHVSTIIDTIAATKAQKSPEDSRDPDTVHRLPETTTPTSDATQPKDDGHTTSQPKAEGNTDTPPKPSTSAKNTTPSSPSTTPTTPNVPVKKTFPLNVMTYNVRGESLGPYADGLPWESRKGHLISAINTHAADIISLQEVHATNNQFSDIATSTQGIYTMIPAAASGDARTRPILFRKSTFTLHSTGVMQLRPSTSTFCGAEACTATYANWAVLTHKVSGQKILFYGIHLPSENNASREEAAINLSRDISSRRMTMPVIIAGDFNTPSPHSAYPISNLGDIGLVDSSTLTLNYTNAAYNSFNGYAASFESTQKNGRHIDKVFVLSSQISVAAWGLILNSVPVNGKSIPASDHWPVWSNVIVQYQT